MYLMLIWFNLSDEGIEDSIYDSYVMCSFVYIDFDGSMSIPWTQKVEHIFPNYIGENVFQADKASSSTC